MIYGAGSPVGREVAKYLALCKYGLILIDNNLDALSETENILIDEVRRHIQLRLIYFNPDLQAIDESKVQATLSGMTNFCINLIINAKNDTIEEISNQIISKKIRKINKTLKEKHE